MAAAARGGDVPVTVAKVTSRDVPVEVQVIGNVEAYSTITVKAQVGGQLIEVHFKEGDFVKKGDLLFDIDQRPSRRPVTRRWPILERDQAALLPGAGQPGARQRQRQISATRRPSATPNLFQSGVISKDQAEQLRANADAAPRP